MEPPAPRQRGRRQRQRRRKSRRGAWFHRRAFMVSALLHLALISRWLFLGAAIADQPTNPFTVITVATNQMGQAMLAHAWVTFAALLLPYGLIHNRKRDGFRTVICGLYYFLMLLPVVVATGLRIVM